VITHIVLNQLLDQGMARVVERLQSPPLSHGIARELRKQQAILEREVPS
jgi:hypothetical protein